MEAKDLYIDSKDSVGQKLHGRGGRLYGSNYVGLSQKLQEWKNRSHADSNVGVGSRWCERKTQVIQK